MGDSRGECYRGYSRGDTRSLDYSSPVGLQDVAGSFRFFSLHPAHGVERKV